MTDQEEERPRLYRDADICPRPDGSRYRYRLWRRWDLAQPSMVWVMLNPSTADAETDDQTLKKCMGFARRHHHGGVILVNLFALMARDPRELQTSADPVGPKNDEHILSACQSGGVIIAGWGARPFARARASHVRKLIDDTGAAVSCLGVTKEGYPRHPLRPPYSSAIRIFSAAS